MSHEPLAAVIAAIAEELPAGHIAAWSVVLATVPGPVTALEASLIDARPGYAVAAHVRRLVDAWRADAPDLSGAAIALGLRSAAQVHRRADGRRTELVISGPISPSVPVRLTSSVVTEVIRSARRSLLVVSFAAYGIAEVIAELAAAADRGVHVDLVLESSAAQGGALSGTSDAAAAFARLRDRATFWHWPAHRRGVFRAALHAKLIAADNHTALISSANLTDRALSANLEVGVVLKDPHVVRRLTQHFAALMNVSSGPLVPLG